MMTAWADYAGRTPDPLGHGAGATEGGLDSARRGSGPRCGEVGRLPIKSRELL